MFSDRDADRIVADNRYAELITGQYIDAVKGKIRDITVNDLDTGIVLTDIADGKTAVQQLDDLRKKLVAEFDNTYGLFDIKLVLGEGGKLLLSFSYQVMQFEGTGTTGTIIYTDSTVSSSFSNSLSQTVLLTPPVGRSTTVFLLTFKCVSSLSIPSVTF